MLDRDTAPRKRPSTRLSGKRCKNCKGLKGDSLVPSQNLSKTGEWLGKSHVLNGSPPVKILEISIQRGNGVNPMVDKLISRKKTLAFLGP